MKFISIWFLRGAASWQESGHRTNREKEQNHHRNSNGEEEAKRKQQEELGEVRTDFDWMSAGIIVLGRRGKQNIQNSTRFPIDEETVLCVSMRVSVPGSALDLTRWYHATVLCCIVCVILLVCKRQIASDQHWAMCGIRGPDSETKKKRFTV